MLIRYLSLFGLFLLISRVLTEPGDEFLRKFQQTDYVLEFERVELASFNKDYFRYFTVVTFKYNRTCPAMNVSYEYLFNVGNDVELIIQGYRFASNEYRLFPLRFQVNYCGVLEDNTFGMASFLRCGNFTGCPQHKGQVHICNWRPESARFPPFVPDGRFMMEIQGVYHSTEIFIMRAYGIVSRPIPYEK